VGASLYLLHQSAYHFQDPHIGLQARGVFPSPMWPWPIGHLEGKANCITFCVRSTWVKPTALRLWEQSWGCSLLSQVSHILVYFILFVFLSAYVCIVKVCICFPIKESSTVRSLLHLWYLLRYMSCYWDLGCRQYSLTDRALC